MPSDLSGFTEEELYIILNESWNSEIPKNEYD